MHGPPQRPDQGYSRALAGMFETRYVPLCERAHSSPCNCTRLLPAGLLKKLDAQKQKQQLALDRVSPCAAATTASSAGLCDVP